MNRGKTALKRGVAVASAAAIAIAGAVLAAPAASADPAPDAAIRATPTADANYVNSDGTASSTYVGGAPYSGTTPTGTAVVVKPGVTNQLVNGFQVVLPNAITANGSITISLPATFTWAAPPQVNTDPVERVAASLNSSAGFAGTNAHVAQALSGGTALPSNVVGPPSIAANVLTVPIGTYSGAASGVYVITFLGVRVNTPSTTSVTPIVATLASSTVAPILAPAVSGATTLGYVSPLSLSLASGAAAADSSGSVTLPNITVSENVAGALSAANLVLNVTTTGTPNTLMFDASATPTAVATGAGLAIGAVAVAPKATPAATPGTITVPISAPSTAAGTVTISGVKLLNVNKNATLTVSIATPGTTGSPTNTNGASGAFTYAPNLLAVSATVATTAPAPRIAGANRYATAAAILAQGTTTGAISAATPWKAGATNAVVIANGETFKAGVDALSANYLAAFEKAPILLTTATSLPVETQTALINLFKPYVSTTTPINVYVMGANDSVSTAVRNQIQSIITSAAGAGVTVNIVPVQGANRYQTSAAAATTVGAGGLTLQSLSTTGAWLPTAFLASGTTNADALAAGAVAAKAGIPVLLTNGTSLDPSVTAAIKNLGIQQVIVLGGPDRVSAALVTSLSTLGVTSTTRIAGADRYTTAADLYSWAFSPVNPSTGTSRGLGWGSAGANTAYVANGTDGFPDALSVGPLAGSQSNPILTTGAATLAPAAATFLTTNKADFATNANPFWALGQSDRISAGVITGIGTALGLS